MSMVLVFAAGVPEGGGVATAAPTTSQTATVAAKAAAKKKYRVKGGVTFNSATGNKKNRRKIVDKITRTIRHAPRGSEIRVFSWKIWTKAGVTALLKAQKRGVRVRAIMYRKNVVVEKNPHYWRLKRGLKQGNKNRKPGVRRSGARLCRRSCRGKKGAAHSKFFVFSKSGRSKQIYMHTSSNWGDAAANRQWNDMYTFVGNKPVYRKAAKVFDQAWKDKPVKGPWVEQATANGSIIAAWSPNTRKSLKNDRLIQNLKRVHCKGARGKAGNANGRTIIRAAPDVIRGKRGMNLAKKLRRLWINGCDVRIGYTVLGKDHSRLLRKPSKRGPVPLRHLVQDANGDGVFDRYFHMKAYTINGRIGKNRKAFFLVQGSSNYSKLSKYSDETFAYFINRPGITKRYQKHIDWWYNNFPSSAPRTAAVARAVANGDIDPYANMDLD